MLLTARIKELETQLAALGEQHAKLQAEHAAFLEEVRAAGITIETLSATVSTQEATINALNADMNTARKTATDAQAALQAETEARDAKITAEVNARLGKAGIAPIRRDPAAAQAASDVLAQLETITDPTARTNFFRANKAAIAAAHTAQVAARQH